MQQLSYIAVADAGKLLLHNVILQCSFIFCWDLHYYFSFAHLLLSERRFSIWFVPGCSCYVAACYDGGGVASRKFENAPVRKSEAGGSRCSRWVWDWYTLLCPSSEEVVLYWISLQYFSSVINATQFFPSGNWSVRLFLCIRSERSQQENDLMSSASSPPTKGDWWSNPTPPPGKATTPKRKPNMRSWWTAVNKPRNISGNSTKIPGRSDGVWVEFRVQKDNQCFPWSGSRGRRRYCKQTIYVFK